MNRWRAILPAIGVIVLLNFVAVLVLGMAPVLDYYYVVGQQIAADLRLARRELSLWTLVPRLFSHSTIEGIRAANRFVALPFDALADHGPLLRFACSWWRRRRSSERDVACLQVTAGSFDSAYGFFCAPLRRINPVVWDHYLMLTAIPIVIIVARLRDAGFPRGPTALALVCLGLDDPAESQFTWTPAAAFQRRRGQRHRRFPCRSWLGSSPYILLLPLAGWIWLLTSRRGRRGGVRMTSPACRFAHRSFLFTPKRQAGCRQEDDQ